MNITYAINNKNLISFEYEGKSRIGEPHILGFCKDKQQLLLWQTGGQTSNNNLPDWRRFDTNKISNFQILHEIFLGPRPTTTGKHAPFDIIITLVR